jgi:hypothetical protein
MLKSKSTSKDNTLYVGATIAVARGGGTLGTGRTTPTKYPLKIPVLAV